MIADVCVQFAAVFSLLQQICVHLYAPRFKETNDRGAAETEVTLLISLVYRLPRDVRLVNGAYPGGTDGNDGNISDILRVQQGELTLVPPQPIQSPAQAKRRYTRQSARQMHRCLRHSVRRKMKTVVIYRAETRE